MGRILRNWNRLAGWGTEPVDWYSTTSNLMKRRDFLGAGLAAGAGLWITNGSNVRGRTSEATPEGETLNVALIGAGTQGRTLINALGESRGIRVCAVCDIWPYRLESAQYYLSEISKTEAAGYGDYREMLDKEKSLDCALIATPDFVHAEQTNACLEAGLHVYCEPMMSHTLDGARSMVRTMRKTGKLLQIGLQRRSNPRYAHVLENLIRQADLLGIPVHVSTRWNHPEQDDLGWPRRRVLPDDVLKRFGFSDMHQFRNWRHFKQYSAGDCAHFIATQADVIDWFLGTRPKNILAAGGLDYYKRREWPDNATAVMEYATEDGALRASSQILTATSGGPHRIYEHFMGVAGSIQVAENPDWLKVYHEPRTEEWNEWVRKGFLVKEEQADPDEDPNAIKVRETGQVVGYLVPIELEKSVFAYHLENFFNAVRDKAPLSCPADVAFHGQVIGLKLNEAIAARKMLEFTETEFEVA